MYASRVILSGLFFMQVVNAKYYCEETWLSNQENGICYKLFPKPQSWKQARETCTREGGFLVSITSDHVMLFVAKNILDNATLVWTGGHSLYDNGWMWDNYQEPFNSTFWILGAFRCLALNGLTKPVWLDRPCTDQNAFICEKSAKALNCDGKPNVIQLQPNKLTAISFPPFYDPLRPFQLPSYETNLNCVWNIVPPDGYRIIMEYYLFCNDDLKGFQGNSRLENVSCREHFGSSAVDRSLSLSFRTDSYTRPRSEQGFQFRLFAANNKADSSCDNEGVPLEASTQKQIIMSQEFPLQRPTSCVWTILSPVKEANIYVQMKYFFLSEQTTLRIQNDRFTKSVILEESGVFVYREETITVNYTSNGSYSGPHGFVLEYYIDEKSVAVCTQKNQSKELSQYGVPNPMNKYIIFSVKATNDIELSLQTQPGRHYYIAFNQSFTGSLCIRKTASLTQCLEEYNGKLLHNGAFRDFWVSWFDTLKVGRGRIPGNDVILDFRVYNPLNVSSISIQARDGIGEWNFFGPVNSTDSIETCHVSGGPLKPLWSLQLPPPNIHYIKFSVRLCERGLISFRITNGTSYLIWLDALKKNDTNQHISCFTERRTIDGAYNCISRAYSTSVLDCTDFRHFWISWEASNIISIGKGLDLGKQLMTSLNSGYPPVPTSFEFGSDMSDPHYIASVWRFVKPPATSEMINITRSQVVPSSQGIEGSTLTMSVDINIRFGFEVKWLRNGTQVSHSPGRFLIQQSFIDVMKCSLDILELKLRDQANWTVVVYNQHYTASTSFDIRVKRGLQIQISPRYELAVQKGSSFDLLCNITNLKDLSGISVDISRLTWYRNDSPLQQDGKRIAITVKGSSSLLRISSTEMSDMGVYSCNHDNYRVTMVINATMAVYNKGDVVCPSSVDVHGIPWPVAIPEKYVHADCPNGKEGNASRLCDSSGTWMKTRVSYCADIELSTALNELQILESDGVSDKEYIEQKFQTSLTKTENLTASEQTISSANILSSISIIDTVLKVANQSNATVPNQNVYSIFDHVTSANNKESWKLVEEETMAGPTSVLDAMERTNSLVMKDSKDKEFRGNNIVVNVSETSIHDSGVQFFENDTFIVLPKQEEQFKASKYSAVLYKTMSQFLPSKANSSRSGPDSVVNSAVMSLTFDHPIQQLSPPLVLTFQHNTGRRMADEDADCVFWDYALFDGTGGWSSEGCSTNSTEGGTTVCLCNHTTNFAILMRPYTPEKEDSALVIISIVGVVISMLFTALTVGIYIYLWKKIKSDQNVLIICLCVSLFLGYLVFLTGVDNAENEAVCIAVTALLHFFLLTTFFMMFGVGTFFFMNVTVLFYAMRITNNFNSRSRLKWIVGSAIGIPLVIVFITLGSCWNTQYHSETFCWLSVNSGAIYAFIAPVLLIFLLNLGIIISLLRVMFLTTKMKKAEFKEKARNALKSVCTLIPVLGVTWIFGIFAINEDAIVFQYIFTIANSIQGLLIFITHVLMNNKIKKTMRAKHPSLKKKRDKGVDHVVSSTTDHSTNNTHTTALVPVNNSVYKDPDKVSETDIHLHTEETESSNTVMERELFLSSMETQIVGGKIITQSGSATHLQTDSRNEAFELKVSSEGVLHEEKKQEVRWGGGGGIIQNFQSEANKYREMRPTRECRVVQTKIERTRVVTSNTSQFSAVSNTTTQNRVNFSQMKNEEEFDA
ncbi:uncharacterized protein [Magallana gigas]|uniref:uncharacterized protein isoform X1 n=1 Tax=Magallana gigas TaxID=29159 RepID=UPI00333EBD95